MYRIVSLGHVRTSRTGIRVPYGQLAAYVPYRVHSWAHASCVRTRVPAPVRYRILLNWPVRARETARVGSDTK